MKHHNARPKTKADLRRRMLARLGLPEYRVLEFFGGPGEMHRRAWHDAVERVAIDHDPESTADYLGDAFDVARRLDLTRFDVFDVDPFASPWWAVWLVGQRVKGQTGRRIGFALTDGAMAGPARLHPTFRGRGWSRQMCDAFGVQPEDSPAGISSRVEAERCMRRLVEGLGPFRIEWWAQAWGGTSGQCAYAAAVVTVT